VAVFDPLDGSSNIDAAISTGTIFGIFLENEQCLIEPDSMDIDQQQLACLLNTLQVSHHHKPDCTAVISLVTSRHQEPALS
jgi:fructose-1,6-bisphosphatase